MVNSTSTYAYDGLSLPVNGTNPRPDRYWAQLFQSTRLHGPAKHGRRKDFEGRMGRGIAAPAFHTVATLMLEGGADIRHVAEMLGHARLETTQRYTRVSIERLRAVHGACHPAAGLSVAMASDLCGALSNTRGAMAPTRPSSRPDDRS